MTKTNTEVVEELMEHRTYFDTVEGKQGFILSERVKFYLHEQLQAKDTQAEEMMREVMRGLNTDINVASQFKGSSTEYAIGHLKAVRNDIKTIAQKYGINSDKK